MYYLNVKILRRLQRGIAFEFDLTRFVNIASRCRTRSILLCIGKLSLVQLSNAGSVCPQPCTFPAEAAIFSHPKRNFSDLSGAMNPSQETPYQYASNYIHKIGTTWKLYIYKYQPQFDTQDFKLLAATEPFHSQGTNSPWFFRASRSHTHRGCKAMRELHGFSTRKKPPIAQDMSIKMQLLQGLTKRYPMSPW